MDSDSENTASNTAQKSWQISDFDIGKSLGHGKFGKVYLCREKKSGYIVAIKAMSRRVLVQSNKQHIVKREIEIQNKLRHDNILRLFGYFWDEKRIYLILEYAPGGNLYEHLKKQGTFLEGQAARYFRQIVSGFAYLHDNHIIHRDIKPENMLFDAHGNIKISDFGWSIDTEDRRMTLCGTLDYLSPELLSQQPYNNSIDLWGLGVLLYEFLAGYPPFESSTIAATQERIQQIDYVFPEHFSESVRDLISRLLVGDPRSRIALREILDHPWIVDNA